MTAYRDRKEAGMYAPPPGADDKFDVEPETVSSEPNLDELTKDELLDLAKQRGITPANAGMSKDELKAALEG